jgi:hypothetical protein
MIFPKALLINIKNFFSLRFGTIALELQCLGIELLINKMSEDVIIKKKFFI